MVFDSASGFGSLRGRNVLAPHREGGLSPISEPLRRELQLRGDSGVVYLVAERRRGTGGFVIPGDSVVFSPQPLVPLQRSEHHPVRL